MKTHQENSREEQKSLAGSRKQLKTMIDSVHTAIVVINGSSGLIAEVNPAALEILEAQSRDLLGRHCREIFCRGNRQHCPISDETIEIKNHEQTIPGPDGTKKHILKTISPFYIRQTRYLLISFVDISPIKATEKSLQQSHNEMEALLSAISSILIEINTADRVIRWNRKAAETFGILSSEASGMAIMELPVDWDTGQIQEGINICRDTRQTYRLNDLGFTRQDGRKGILGLTFSPFYNNKKRASGILIMGADITDRKNLESQLAQAQKLESIGQLAAGIAHEINTPIQYVGDNTQFLKQAFEDIFHVLEKYGHLADTVINGGDPRDCIAGINEAIADADLEFLRREVPDAVEQTLQGVNRVSGIVKSMKDFSHPGSEEKVALDINKALESTLIISRNEYKYVSDAVTDFDKNLPPVNCFAGEINQVFLNIIINAAHAIADTINGDTGAKGTITVRTRNTGNAAEIAISDTGKGIPEKDLPYIFDPFFTTKEVGKGTGQGLSLSYATVVEKHGGTLYCTSEPGKGSTFVLRLPF